MNKYVTEVSEGNEERNDGVDANMGTGKPVATNSTQVQHQASSSSMRALCQLVSDTGHLFLPRREISGNATAVPTGYRRQYAESCVIKINFEKLTDPSNEKSCALSVVAMSPLWTSVIGPRMNGSNN